MEHIAACCPVTPIFIGRIDAFKYQLYRQQSVLPGAVGGGIANVGLHRVGQGIHAGCGSKKRRQTQSNHRVQHRVPGNQRKIIDGILVAAPGICDNRRQSGLAPGPRSGGNRHQKGQPPPHLQNPLHLSQGLPRPGDAGSRCLGTVHAGAFAKADDTVASRPAVKPHRLLHIICGGVGGCLVVDAIGKPFVRQGLLQWTDESQTPDSLVCDNQGSAAAVPADDFGQSPHAPHCLRRPVGQEGEGDF